jgi:4-amino-4-deoxy-L-arabinose transferase-like glycosyltransferase
VSLGSRLLLVALALAIFLPGIGSRDLWNPDEPRYTEVALEMRATGDWFVPHLNGRVYSEKPPLHFWAIALASSIPGLPVEVAARLPALVAVIASLLLVAEIGRRLFDPGTGLLAGLIFLSASKVLWQGRVGQIDMTLTALMLASLLAFVRGMVERRPELHRWFFFFAGLATLAKGPVGLLPPLIGIALFALATGRRQLLAEMRIPTGLLIWAAVVLAWLVPAGWIGGKGYLATIVLRQNVTRYAEPWHHFQPWYYYLEAIVVDFFPWSFFLPGAVWIGLRRTAGETRRGIHYLLASAVATLVFFSVSPAKRTVYIVPMYPLLALAIAAAFTEIESTWPRLRRQLTVPAALLATLATAIPLAGWFVFRHPPASLAPRVAALLEELRPMGAGLLAEMLVLTLLLAVAAQAALLAARRGRPRLVVLAWSLGFATFAAIASACVLPRFDAVKSARPLSARLLEVAPASEPYAVWPRLDATFLVYTKRHQVELLTREDLEAYVRRPGRVWLLIDARELEQLPEPLPMTEVARDEDRRDGYVLMASSPPR